MRKWTKLRSAYIRYADNPGLRVLDMTQEGLPCVPVLGRSAFSRVRHPTAEHVHPECFEFIYCRTGYELTFRRNGEEHVLRPGWIAFSAPGERHCLRTRPKGVRVDYFFFRTPPRGCAVLGLSVAETRWMFKRLAALEQTCFKGSQRIALVFRQLFALYDDSRVSGLERRLKFRQLFLSLLLEIIDIGNGLSSAEDDGRAVALVKDIQKNPAGEYSGDTLVRRLGMSPTALVTAFKEKTGLPPHAFVIRCRIQRAKELLRKRTARIEGVALQLGYKSFRRFSSQFKTVVGLTPREWRTAQQ